MDVGIVIVLGLAFFHAEGFLAVAAAAEESQLGGHTVATLDMLGSPRPPAQPPALPSHRRPRRCTCYSYKDKECVYYCHLDIIWINTPERTVPYGMSSYRGPQRMRRSPRISPDELRRCFCSEQLDLDCSNFCRLRSLELHSSS